MVAHAGMLSWSAEKTNTPLDLRSVTDRTVDSLLPGGAALLRLVDAVVMRSVGDIAPRANDVNEELGRAGLVDAAGVIGNFQMMNRVADGTGMPVTRGARIRNAEIIDLLGLERFDHEENAP